MKRFLLIWFLLFSVCASAQIDQYVPRRPSPPRLVNDVTKKTLTDAQIQALEHKLVAYDDSTSNQIAVVLVPTTGDYSVEQVALEILRRWGVGGSEHNNGVVILAAIDDHKVRIETGYGLEGAIPDVIAKAIIDNDITPNFKAQNYYRGLDLATDDIIKAAAGEYKAPANYGSKKRRGINWSSIIFVIIFILIAIGGGGGRGGNYVSRRGSRGIGFPWWWFIGTGGGWGGGSGGGGWSGGGGGFGGFGGGGGGGGGASGSW